MVSPTFCRTIDTLVKISVSLVLLFYRATNIVVQSDALLVLSMQCVVSLTFLRLLIRYSKDYRNDRITHRYDYFNRLFQLPIPVIIIVIVVLLIIVP